jgi:hypothetical protein
LEQAVQGFFETSSSTKNTQPQWQVKAQEIADGAMRRAGHMPNPWGVRLADIGVLGYHGDETPDVCRDEPVPMTSTHLRPFVVINLPYEQGAQGSIQFELVDRDGIVQFAANHRYQLTYGQNFVTSPTWLPLEGVNSDGQWSMRVSIGQKVIAEHQFEVRPRQGTAMRSYLHADGEIEEWMHKSIQQQKKSGVSLDELLGDQPELDAEEFVGVPQQKQNSRRQ